MNVVQNNLVSIVILIILFLGVFKQVNHKDPVYRAFLTLLVVDVFMLLLEMILFLLSNMNGSFIYGIMALLAVFYHALIPITLFLMFMFIEFHFHPKPYKIWRYIIPFTVLFIANFVMVVLSLNNGFIFQITGNNIYDIGSLYIIYESTVFAVFLLIFGFTVIQRKKLDKKTFLPLIIFIIPVTIAYILIVFAGFYYLTWNAFMIALFIIYVFMQIQITSTDYLTGLQNRRGYEYLLFNLSKVKVHNDLIIGIMIDIDNFKNINDQHGHHIGDEALIALGSMMKKAVRKNDFVSRTGGDEFAIIIKANEPNVSDVIIERINTQLNIFNKKNEYGLKLQVSIGCDIYDEDKHHSIPDFFEYLDKEMYRDKRKHVQVGN